MQTDAERIAELEKQLYEEQMESARLREGVRYARSLLQCEDDQKQDNNWCSAANFHQNAKDVLDAALEGEVDYRKAKYERWLKWLNETEDLRIEELAKEFEEDDDEPMARRGKNRQAKRRSWHVRPFGIGGGGQ